MRTLERTRSTRKICRKSLVISIYEKLIKIFLFIEQWSGRKAGVDENLTAAGAPSTSCNGVSGCAD